MPSPAQSTTGGVTIGGDSQDGRPRGDWPGRDHLSTDAVWPRAYGHGVSGEAPRIKGAVVNALRRRPPGERVLLYLDRPGWRYEH